jgi:hypothetical protein
MSTRKRIAITFALISIASITCCFLILPPIFPVQPPPEFHQVKAGMHINEVKAILGNNPHVVQDDKKIEDGVVIEPVWTWMDWPANEGLIQVSVNKQDRIEMVVFQRSRSSVVENVQEIWRLTRFLK